MNQETVEQVIHRTGKRKKIIYRSCLCIVLLGIIGMTNTCTLFFAHGRSHKIVAQWKQPDDIKYDGYSPYYLSVIERKMSWNPLTGGFNRHYTIYTGKDDGLPGYGHFIDFSFYTAYGSDDNAYDIPSVIKKADVEWQPEGITMMMSSGHKLFIPQRYFTGGR